MTFNLPGKQNTQEVISLALAAAKEQGITGFVVSSNSGSSALQLSQAAPAGSKIVCVTHVAGFKNPGEIEISPRARDELSTAGVEVLMTTHVLSGAERGLSKAFGGIYPIEIMAASLRMFGQGVKVCVEISVMALDAGMIAYGEPVIALSGTSRGLDTAIIIRPSHASSIIDTKIDTIICKPKP